jgi:hypothetical protein
MSASWNVAPNAHFGNTRRLVVNVDRLRWRETLIYRENKLKRLWKINQGLFYYKTYKTNKQMGQRKWLGMKVMKDKYHHSEDPRYGRSFQIKAIQFESIEKEKFSSWIEDGEIQFGGGITISFSDYLKRMRKMGKTNLEWKIMKNKMSDAICRDLNRLVDMCTNLNEITRVKDVVAYKVHYFGDPKEVYQIL